MRAAPLTGTARRRRRLWVVEPRRPAQTAVWWHSPRACHQLPPWSTPHPPSQASGELQDAALGLYDSQLGARFALTPVQREALRRVGAAGSRGALQSELASALGAENRNFFYVVRVRGRGKGGRPGGKPGPGLPQRWRLVRAWRCDKPADYSADVVREERKQFPLGATPWRCLGLSHPCRRTPLARITELGATGSDHEAPSRRGLRQVSELFQQLRADKPAALEALCARPGACRSAPGAPAWDRTG